MQIVRPLVQPLVVKPKGPIASDPLGAQPASAALLRVDGFNLCLDDAPIKVK